MRLFFKGVVKQLLIPFTDKKGVIMFILFLFSAWIAMEAYHSLTVQKLPVAVVDFDNSALSRSFIKILMNNRTIAVKKRGFDNLKFAKTELEKGELAGILLIPSKFSKEIKNGRTAHIAAYLDASNILISKNVNKAILKSAIIMGAGIGVVKMRHLGMPVEQAVARAMPIELAAANTFNPALNYAVYIVPGLLFFLLQVYITLLVAGLYQPKLFNGCATSRAGHITGIFIFTLLLALMFYYIWMPYITLTVHSDFILVLAITALFIVSEILFVMAIHKLLFFMPPLAMDASVLLAMLSLTFSGITWPTDMFPDWIAAISYIMPFRPFAQSFQVFIHGNVEAADLLIYIKALYTQAAIYGTLSLIMTLFVILVAKKREKHE